ncbi:hypothetical protein IV203_025290 [Nitzschia inconspicua]|uniref:Uncharacterized protein n=1 Tax=Nitzschia inconspicua TaxID=303405 RepID=A0A9K3K9X8_9STRA|nr:hypothetical protein IV203_024705 [Nitzschia inconspicua]KAG7362406.1 hypothetical protein IV203_025290 [Nitzschia inconspicua]
MVDGFTSARRSGTWKVVEDNTIVIQPTIATQPFTLSMIKNNWSDDEEEEEDATKKATINWGWDSRTTTKTTTTESETDTAVDNPRNLDGFNPWKYNAATATSSFQSSPAQVAGKSTRISLRATQMQDLNRALLDAVGGSPENRHANLRTILQQYQDFLLEPLEDSNTVLEEDSIYTPQMTRSQRYQTFRKSMNDRIENSRNLKVKAVLEAMRDFVLEFE